VRTGAGAAVSALPLQSPQGLRAGLARQKPRLRLPNCLTTRVLTAVCVNVPLFPPKDFVLVITLCLTLVLYRLLQIKRFLGHFYFLRPSWILLCQCRSVASH
jgi:hypothetical protein